MKGWIWSIYKMFKYSRQWKRGKHVRNSKKKHKFFKVLFDILID